MASTITMLTHLQIPLEEVVKATNNFGDKYVIGQGGFGKVYKGQLSRSGELVNIVARRLDRKRGQGDVEFWTEISMLYSLEHENIISLIGFCDENGEKIIISTREAKGSLSMYLSDPTQLTWIQRLKICVGVARALRYIHNGEGRGSCVIHRNINSSTILLDDTWEAKLSGFEFSIKQSIDRMDRVLLSDAIGTTGYMDPSIVKTGGVTFKSDIYSFGVVLCEILCGRKAFIPDGDDRFVAPLFRTHYERESLNDIIPPDLRYQMTKKSLNSFSKAAYSCLKEDWVQRPDMNDIVIELEKALEFQQPLENLIKKSKHLKIPLSDIMLATDNFSKAYQIRHLARHHELYIAELEHFDEENPSIKEGKNKGELPRRRNTVVIYRVHPSEGENGEEMFYTEIKMLDTCKHPSIVKLLGYCYEGSEMILVVEHLSNGYLFGYWLDNAMRRILTWTKRLKICLDVANALNYLHTEMEDQKTIIHCDIKSSNIALDENWGAKIVHFGFSVFLPPNQDDDALYHESRGGMATYVDPEYRKTGKLKRESDIYSFGVVLFEVLCGRLAYDSIYEKESYMLGLAFVARRCFQEGTLMEMIDPMLKKIRGPNKDSLEKFVKIAHDCIAETQDQRPTMKMVIKELQEALFFQVADEVKKSMELKLARENSVLHNLKFLDLSYSKLAKTPDFNQIPNLERLNLGFCLNLLEMDSECVEIDPQNTTSNNNKDIEGDDNVEVESMDIEGGKRKRKERSVVWNVFKKGKQTVHFIDKQWVLQKRVLAFSFMEPPHSGVAFMEPPHSGVALHESMSSRDEYMKAMARSMMEKFQKYWSDFNLTLAIAVVFDPRYKLEFIEWSYKKVYGEWSTQYDIVDRLLYTTFDEYVVLNAGNGSSSTSNPASSSGVSKVVDESSDNTSRPHGVKSKFLDFDQFQSQEFTTNNKSELKLYLEEPRMERTMELDVLVFWRANEFRYPILARMARDFLTIPVSTVASESTFSASGRVLDQHRSALSKDIVEALICTKDWLFADSGSNETDLDRLTEDIIALDLTPESDASNSISNSNSVKKV